MPTTLYHNPRCSKSRDTLKLLHEHGIQPQIVEYLKAPLNVAMLQNIQSALGQSRRDHLLLKWAAVVAQDYPQRHTLGRLPLRFQVLNP